MWLGSVSTTVLILSLLSMDIIRIPSSGTTVLIGSLSATLLVS